MRKIVVFDNDGNVVHNSWFPSVESATEFVARIWDEGEKLAVVSIHDDNGKPEFDVIHYQRDYDEPECGE